MKWIAVALLLVGSAAAADCPGELKYAVSTHNVPECLSHHCLWIGLVNKTEKKIVGAKFGVEFIDAVGDPHGSPSHYTSADKVKPNKKNEYRWITDGEVQDDARGANAWVEKLLFEDGTKWEDDGGRTCQWKNYRNR